MANQQEEQEMQQPESIYAKLRKVQLELKAPKSQFNGFGKYSYRNQEDILEAVKPLLAKYGLTQIISDEIVERANSSRVYVESTVTIFNDSGEHITVKSSAREEQDKKGMDGAQVTGASSSYARKYALNGMYAIDDTKDADSGSPHSTTAAKPAYQAPKPSYSPPAKPIADVTPTPSALVSTAQISLIAETMKAKGYTDKEEVIDVILTVTKSPNIQAMTILKADNLLTRLKDASKEQIDLAYRNLKNPYEGERGISEEEMEGYHPNEI
jgi:hypothetical protein